MTTRERCAAWLKPALCLILLVLVFFAGLSHISGASDDSALDLSEGWVARSGAQVALPAMLVSGEDIVLTLPEQLPDECEMYIKTNYQRVKAYIDGAPIAVRGMSESTLFHMTNDCPWTALSLDGAQGKSLTLSFSGHGSKSRVEVYSALAGEDSDIRFRLFASALPKLISCALIALIALALCMYAIMTATRDTLFNFKRLMMFSAFSALAAIWMFTDTDLQGVFFIGNEAYFLMNLFSYMLMPLPFILIVRSSGGENRNAVNISVGILIVAIAMSVLSMALGIYRLYLTLTATHITLTLAICLALYQCARDYSHNRDSASIETLLSLSVLSAAGLCAIVQFYAFANSDNTLLYRFGILVFVLVLSLDAVRGNAALVAKARSFEQLRVREEEYRVAAEHSGKLILRYDIQRRAAYLQPNAAAELALPEVLNEAPDALINSGVIAPESFAELARLFSEMRAGHLSGSGTVRMSHEAPKWYHADYTTIFTPSGTPTQAIMSLYDITDLREKEMAYEKWRQNYNMLKREKINYYEYNLTKDTFDHEEGGMLPPIAPDAKRTLSEIAQHTASNYAYHEDRARLLEFYSRDRLLARYYSGVHAEEMEWRRVGADGEPLWTLASVQLIPDPYSSDVKGFILLKDIDQEKKTELMVHEQRERDSLTSLYNRGAFIKRFNALIENAPADARHALLMIDIDGFKRINDTFGHYMGDCALTQVAQRLQALSSDHSPDCLPDCPHDCLKDRLLVGRIGGDEFVVCIENIPHAQDALISLIKRISDALKFKYESQTQITGSIGAAIFPTDGATFDILYPRADQALYNAKRNGEGLFAFYSETSDN